MIELYAFSTPNSVRVPIALEELGLAYDLKSVNVRLGEQRGKDHLTRNPNAKVPVLVDHVDGKRFTLTESGAILIYLAEKTGKLLPADPVGRARVFESMMFHLTGIGPAMGQLGFFRRADEQLPMAINRFAAETDRVLKVLDGILAERRWVAGDEFTIADITHFGWLWRRAFAMVELGAYPHVTEWYERVATRPAVQRGIARADSLLQLAA
jgi:GST-like protein